MAEAAIVASEGDVLVRSEDPCVLQSLDAGPAAGAVWMRRLDPGLADWLESLVFPMPRQGRWRLPSDAPIPPSVRQWMAVWLAGIEVPPTAWLDELGGLLARAREAFVGADLRVRLDVVSNDGCRLFHVDHLRVRWICTYRGRGTQYAPEHAVERGRLGSGAHGAIRDPAAVRELAPGWVAALRGEAWPGAEGRGLVHRSPPAAPAAPRIVLVIDPA